MLGPYRVECRDCEYAEQVDDGESARAAANRHREEIDHLVRVECLTTGRERLFGD